MTRTKSLTIVAVSVAILSVVALVPNPAVAQSGQSAVSGQSLNWTGNNQLFASLSIKTRKTTPVPADS